MKAILFTLCLIFASLNSFSQLSIYNATEKNIYVAIAYYSVSEKCYKTMGWYTVEPFTTKPTSLSFTESYDEFFYHTFSDEMVWEGGDISLLVDPINKFNISFAEFESTFRDNPSLAYKSFKKISVFFEENQTKKYTLEFTTEAQKKKANFPNETLFSETKGALKIENYDYNSFKFQIIGLTNQSCKWNYIEGTANVLEVNENTVDENYKGPMVWWQYNTEDGCYLLFEIDFYNYTVKITEESCTAKHESGCKDWSGIYILKL